MPEELYSFSFSRVALDALKGMQKQDRERTRRKIARLAQDPTGPGTRQLVNAVHNGLPVRRVRSGAYRVLYTVHENPSLVVILDIGHRKDIYR